MKISVEEKIQRRERILNVLAQSGGLTEAELTAQTGLERRTLNNHLRWLQQAGQVRKDGLVWYARHSKAIRIIDQIIDLLNQLKDEL